MSNPQGNIIIDTLELNKSAHPGLIITDLILKFSPIIIYLTFGLLFNSDYFVLFIVYIVSAMEFWWTKNVTGRILVGLYWETKVNEDGTEETVYRIKRDEKLSNAIDRKMFWGFLFIMSLFWSLMSIKNIIFIQNPIGPAIPTIIGLTNMINFF